LWQIVFLWRINENCAISKRIREVDGLGWFTESRITGNCRNSSKSALLVLFNRSIEFAAEAVTQSGIEIQGIQKMGVVE
jgi:hypothetical protein